MQEKDRYIYQTTGLAEKDRYISQIENQIQAKRNLLLNKQKYFQGILKENSFLEGVRNDYDKYRTYIIKEKMEQLRAMNILKQYTKDLISSTQMTDEKIHESKHDQYRILQEMEKIKKDLDEIIDSNM